MKFTVDPNLKQLCEPTVRVGDVFQAKGGCRKNIAMWVVAGVRDGYCSMLGLNQAGEISSATCYALHAMEKRERIGFVKELNALEFTITREVNHGR